MALTCSKSSRCRLGVGWLVLWGHFDGGVGGADGQRSSLLTPLRLPLPKADHLTHWGPGMLSYFLGAG